VATAVGRIALPVDQPALGTQPRSTGCAQPAIRNARVRAPWIRRDGCGNAARRRRSWHVENVAAVGSDLKIARVRSIDPACQQAGWGSSSACVAPQTGSVSSARCASHRCYRRGLRSPTPSGVNTVLQFAELAAQFGLGERGLKCRRGSRTGGGGAAVGESVVNRAGAAPRSQCGHRRSLRGYGLCSPGRITGSARAMSSSACETAPARTSHRRRACGSE